jgi:hypothetical protein
MMQKSFKWRRAGVALALLAAALSTAAGRLNRGAGATETGEAPRIDPIEANGPIFVDWPKPKLAIAFTGELDGYIEPCGCAGLENQLGGLKRRHTLFKQLEDQGWPLVRLDMGGLTKLSGAQTEIKYRYIVEGLVEMGYQAVGIGANELKLSTDALAQVFINVPPEKSPMLSANLGVYGFDAAKDMGVERYRIIEAGGKKIGVTSVLGARHALAAKNLEYVEFVPPVEALATVAPQLAAEHCDLQVLMVHGDPHEAAELSRQFPQFQLVAAAGGAEEPPSRPATIDGSAAALIETGHKGMYVAVLAIFDDPDQPYRYQRVPLDARFADSPEMQAKLVAYQKELETMTLAGLGLTGVAHPDGDYIGSEICADCHTSAWEVFENTPHYHATDTLVHLDPPRHFDPECLSCHVTGWHPQEYFPYSSGYMGLESTPQLKQNGCENCHGPSRAHVAAESGDVEATDEQLEALRAALRMEVVTNEGNMEGQEFGAVVKNCMQCHDLDNSPDFDFQKYWPDVQHEGME